MSVKTGKKVSIIVPVYNVERYLPECLNSIRSQTYKDIELILVDDGSTDGSGKICDCCARSDARVVAVHQKNAGVSAARNKGMSLASGEFILFVDADDVASSELVETLVRDIEDSYADVAVCGFSRFEKEYAFSAGKRGANARAKTIGNKEALKEMLYGRKIDSGPFCKLIKRSLLKGVVFDERLVVGEDFDFLCRLFLKDAKIVRRRLSLYGYRVRQDSAMEGAIGQGHMGYMRNVLGWENELLAQYPELKEAVAYRVFGVASYVIGKIGPRRDEFKEEYTECGAVLSRYSKIVAKDANAGAKNRLLAVAYVSNAGLAANLRVLAQRLKKGD